jgi:putative hemolysin
MRTKVINKSDVQKAIKVKGPAGKLLAGMLMRVLELHKMNDIYGHIYQYQGIEFADKLLEHLDISCDIVPEELDYLPQDQPFIVVSNHPFGGIDGVMMLSILGKKRPDLKILTNFILSLIPNLSGNFFPVNPFTDRPGMKSSLGGLKMAKEHLASGGVLGLFPSGEVSSNANKEKVVKDIPWQPSIIKLIKGAGVPVVPIYFSGENSKLFHLMGKINPYLRTARLPHELVNKRGKTIGLRIGKPIMPTELEEFADIHALGKYLWNRTYALEANIPDSTVETAPALQQAPAEPIAPHVPQELLCADIESIAAEKLFEVRSYECYLARTEQIPNLMKEIAISREETFRAVGEGTGKAMDTDEYDTYYRHLILWDKVNRAFVGAYRLGIGWEIVDEYGLKGFYSDTLFKYKKEFAPYLKETVELGRSYVVPEYQKDPLALMLLIKGLMYTAIKYPQVRYFIGPVSISAWYPYFYRSLMVHYLEKKQSVPHLQGFVSPVHPFEPDFLRVNIDELVGGKMESLEKFDRFMLRMSNNSYRLPTLLKKYLKINAKILAFNVDPDFNYCVDGLIMLDLLTVPKSEIDQLSKEFEDKESVYRRFGIEC